MIGHQSVTSQSSCSKDPDPSSSDSSLSQATGKHPSCCCQGGVKLCAPIHPPTHTRAHLSLLPAVTCQPAPLCLPPGRRVLRLREGSVLGGVPSELYTWSSEPQRSRGCLEELRDPARAGFRGRGWKCFLGVGSKLEGEQGYNSPLILYGGCCVSPCDNRHSGALFFNVPLCANLQCMKRTIVKYDLHDIPSSIAKRCESCKKKS